MSGSGRVCAAATVHCDELSEGPSGQRVAADPQPLASPVTPHGAADSLDHSHRVAAQLRVGTGRAGWGSQTQHGPAVAARGHHIQRVDTHRQHSQQHSAGQQHRRGGHTRHSHSGQSGRRRRVAAQQHSGRRGERARAAQQGASGVGGGCAIGQPKSGLRNARAQDARHTARTARGNRGGSHATPHAQTHRLTDGRRARSRDSRMRLAQAIDSTILSCQMLHG